MKKFLMKIELLISNSIVVLGAGPFIGVYDVDYGISSFDGLMVSYTNCIVLWHWKRTI